MTGREFGRFFLPGPTEVHPDVLASMLQPMIPHRGPQMVDLLEGADAPLRQLFCTERPVLVGTCAGTGFMEMAVRSGVRQRALCLVGGAFGERFAGIVEATGRDAIRLNVPLGKTVEPDMLEDALKRSEVDAVTAVHSETSTGSLASVAELATVVQQFDDVLLLVDGVTSVGGSPVRTDEWGLDFVFTGSQKALALPPGLALGVASDRMVERAKRTPERGAYLDVVAYHEAASKYQPTNTPGISTLYALREQLKRIAATGGIEARWARHEAMRQTVENWVAGRGGDLGFSYLPSEGRRSWTISCLQVPEGRNGREIAKDLAGVGWTIGSGYGGLKEQTIRIGHMGDHTVTQVTELLQVMESILQ
ncbi:MAG: alanine--glyoxylate aminotransferase family protein [Gemmatimonadota bacterium]|nr:MAG: alanine--glyoxylate aminotransferase family protein [Gemmatimonadota bacterium]